MQHLEFRAFARAGGEPCDPAAQGLSLEELQRIVGLALRPPPESEAEAEEAGCADGARVEIAAADGALLVRSGANDVGQMQELRDRVLSGEFDAAVARAMGPDTRWSLHADRTEFAEQYEERALALRTLTEHQREKLEECECTEGGRGVDVHLRAPAGAGKTFVALHRVLDALEAQPSNRALFVARNEALACFAASWLGKRMRRGGRRRRWLLGRLHLLYEPFEQGVREVRVKSNRVVMQVRDSGAALGESAAAYALVVVDEAHHLYSDPVARGLVEAQVTAGCTRRLLLSDISQSLGRGVAYPEGLREVVLSEVVRCSKRIVAGAMAFQLGGEEKLLTKCHHEATGPPLQSFLFDLPADCSEGGGLFEAYAEHTVRALEHVVAAFPGLSLHNRLAIVVPDSDFLEGLRPVLETALAQRFPDRRLCLVAAAVASSDLGGGEEAKEDEGEDSTMAPSKTSREQLEEAGLVALLSMPVIAEQDLVPGNSTEAASGGQRPSAAPEEWLVLDTVHQVDGLERLVVLGVGLDSAIRGEDASASTAMDDETGSKALQARSMLYRAVTRAHLMFLVVNEFLRGGFLEFLGSVRLREDEAFDSSAELARSEAQAVEGVVLADLTAAVSDAAKERGFQLSERAVSTLASHVAAARERGEALGASLEAVFRSWSFAHHQVVDALRAASRQSGAAPLPDASALAALMGPVTLDCYRGEIVNLPLTVSEALKRHQSKALQDRAGAALEAAVKAFISEDLSKQALQELRARVIFAVERGQSVEVAATKAARGWVQAKGELAFSLQIALDEWGKEDTVPRARLEEAKQAALVSVACHGEAVGQAVKTTLWQLDKELIDAELTAAITKVAAEEAAAPKPPCVRGGGRVRLVDLRNAAELNGKEGLVQHFIAATGRWVVQIEQRSTPMGLRPGNLQVLKDSEWRSLPLPPLSEASTPILNAARLEMRLGISAKDAVGNVKSLWRMREAMVASVLDVAAAARQLQPSAEVMAGIVRSVTEKTWQQPLADGQNEPADSDSEGAGEGLGALAAAALSDWEVREHSQQQEAAYIASAIEAAANSQRLLLTDAALASLQTRVAGAVRRGEDINTAVAAALREYHRQVVRKQVQQTVWDPSGNQTRKVTGVLRFMPFKQKGAERFEYELLISVFQVLPFRQLGELARVCKRWRSVATDPSWKPELLACAWGDAHVTGLSRACPRPTILEFSLAKRIVKIACADAATLALTEEGTVWFWGKSWLLGRMPDQAEPTLVQELRDVVCLATSPPGYFHSRGRHQGYPCAAVTRGGDLYTWGLGRAGQLLHEERAIYAPRRVAGNWSEWAPARERALFVACGLDFLALCIERQPSSSPAAPRGMEGGSTSDTAVLSCGIFNHHLGAPHKFHEWPELRGVPLRQLVAGSFHCCALTTRGDLYTFGDPAGQDQSNGNLLGHGPPQLHRDGGGGGDPRLAFVKPPCRVQKEGLGPISEVSCSTYSTIAITVDGRVFSWGDCDGDALGHDATTQCHSPTRLTALRWQRVAHGSMAYTNGAVATSEGRVFVWGGNYWEGGIAEGRNAAGPTEVKWGGVPSCYRCSSVALAHRHGYLIFRKQP